MTHPFTLADGDSRSNSISPTSMTRRSSSTPTESTSSLEEKVIPEDSETEPDLADDSDLDVDIISRSRYL